MSWKKRQLLKSNLYLVLDTQICKNLIKVAESSLDNGVDIIQLRSYNLSDKKLLRIALTLKKLAFKKKKLFIMNNRADIAKLVNADGIHLGKDDLPVRFARKILGKNAIIGRSCYGLSDARIAAREGADYLGIGPVFKTALKPDYRPIGLKIAALANREINLPTFAIGGINENNLEKVIRFGIRRIAVCRAICCSPERIKNIRLIKTYLKGN